MTPEPALHDTDADLRALEAKWRQAIATGESSGYDSPQRKMMTATLRLCADELDAALDARAAHPTADRATVERRLVGWLTPGNEFVRSDTLAGLPHDARPVYAPAAWLAAQEPTT